MPNKCSLPPKETAQELGAWVKTIHRWDAVGKPHKVRTAGNQRRIPIEEAHRLQRQVRETAERCVIYARVSSVRQEQDGNLTRQAFGCKGVRLEVLEPLQAQEPTQNMLAIVTLLAERLYERQATGLRKRVEIARKRM